MADSALVYNSHCKKYEVSRKCVCSLAELRTGDHIAFHQMCNSYWHHAIVESIDSSANKLDVIEYSNTAIDFLDDNCSPPRKLKDIELAKVKRVTYNFQSGGVYLMSHAHCLDPDTVVQRARGKLNERQYNPLTNNCEHFAMWCKTGESSSDQVNKAKEMLQEEYGKAAPCGAMAIALATFIQIVTIGIGTKTEIIVSTPKEEFGKIMFSVTTSTTLVMSTHYATAPKYSFGYETMACRAVFEAISAVNDILYAYEDMKEGQISRVAFKKAAFKKFVTSLGSFVGSSIGMIVGQVALFFPFVGGLVGSVVGGLVGSFMFNMAANAAFP